MAGENILVIDDSPTLLRIIARTLGRVGYKVRTAEGGARGVTLAKQHRPDVILLDYLMPGLNGEDVCRALGQEPTLRDVPVVVMSSRGDTMGARLVQTLGAVDYISKPFSPDAIVAVTSHTIHKYVREGTPPPRLMPSEGAAGGVTSRPAAPTGRAEHMARVRSQLAQAVAPALAEAVAAMPDDALRDPAARASAIEHALSSALSESALVEVARLCVAAAPEAALTGDAILRAEVGKVALADLLQILQLQKQTGVLEVVRHNEHAELYFREGRIDWVGGRNLREEFLLGRFIVETQALSHQDLDLFLDSRSGTRKLLGAQLVKLGYITPDDLAAALAHQSSEIVYELLRWRDGHCVFRQTEARPPHVADAWLDLSVEQVLMEGFRRVDAWSLIEAVIHSFEIIFARNEEAILSFGVEQLEPAELVVLELIEGQNRVRDLVEKSRMGSFEVCQILYRLLGTRLIRKRVEPAPL